jgi:hydrogenase maturation protease
MTDQMLIAGVGNIFLSDDGFGVEVVRHLAELELPGWVRVADYGISGMHLAYDLANGIHSAILIDATPRGGTPGTVYVIEPERPGQHVPSGSAGPTAGTALFDAHGMQPDVVFGMLDMLGAQTGRVLIVGCEPARADYGIGLSAPVAAAVDEAVRVVLGLVAAHEREATGADGVNEAQPGEDQ